VLDLENADGDDAATMGRKFAHISNVRETITSPGIGRDTEERDMCDAEDDGNNDGNNIFD
jgi:hypothetical protein